jgi:hypothetical protein
MKMDIARLMKDGQFDLSAAKQRAWERVNRTTYDMAWYDRLQFKNPELGDVMVQNVLAEPQRFEGEALVDPDEDRGSYPDDSARFYYNKGLNPIVVSWGHGGRTFKLIKGGDNGSRTNDGGDDEVDLGDDNGEFETEVVDNFGAGGKSKSNRNADNGSGNRTGHSDTGSGGGGDNGDHGNHSNNSGGGGDWREELRELIDEQNLVWNKVMFKGQSVVMKETSIKFRLGVNSGWFTQTYWEFYQVKQLEQHYVGQGEYQYGVKPMANGNSAPIMGNRFVAWNNSPDKNYYEHDVVFLPNAEPEEGYFNTWRGFAFEAKKNPTVLKNLYRHLKDVICDKDKELYEYLLNWIAFSIQYPASLPEVALVWKGGEGAGKGIIAHFLRRLWGSHGFYASSSDGLVGKHNEHLGQTCLLVADEVLFAGDPKTNDQLKPIISDGMLTIEPKYIKKFQQANFLKIIMLTNHDWSVQASALVRRYAVFEVSDKRIADFDYFSELCDDLNKEKTSQAFMFDMLNRDITKFNPRKYPENKGIKQQRRESLEPWAEWLVECAENGFFGRRHKQQDDSNFVPAFNAEIAPHELFEHFKHWLDDSRFIARHGTLISVNKLSTNIQKYFEAEKPRRINGKVQRGFKFISLKNFREVIENKFKIILN